MKKTDTFFVIDNFNTVPLELIGYCENYHIYDASTNSEIQPALEKAGMKFQSIARTGHNISTYFRFFAEHYDDLPDVMCLTKGHMIGRHCSKEFFDRVYDNKYFTYLYEDKNVNQRMGYNFLTMENQYIERNDSWYVGPDDHPKKYFFNFNDLLKFIYKSPTITEYLSFAPGGCYIVCKSQVLKHSREFYLNLNKIMTYGLDPNYPAEAFMIERMLPIIFTSNYEENEWMNSLDGFDEMLIPQIQRTKREMKFRREHQLQWRIQRKISQFQK